MPTVRDIANLLKVPVVGRDESLPLTGIATLRDAGPGDLSFLSSDEYLEQFTETRASAVIVDRAVKLPPSDNGRTSSIAMIVVDDAELALARALELFAGRSAAPPAGIDSSARVSTDATIGDGHRIGPFVSIGHRTRIGRNATIHAGVSIGDDVQIGDDCQIFPNVVVRERITIGHRVILNAGCVIGTDGFGYKWDKQLKQHVKIPHIGTVFIEDDVEIGSCTCIDRAKFAATRIGRGSKLDNLVQIGHNVEVGPMCIIAGTAGIAGSAKLGAGVVIGGAAAVRDHITVGDRTRIAMCSAVFQDTEPDAVVSGIPAHTHSDALRAQAALRRLPELFKKVRELQREIKELQSQIQK